MLLDLKQLTYEFSVGQINTGFRTRGVSGLLRVKLGTIITAKLEAFLSSHRPCNTLKLTMPVAQCTKKTTKITKETKEEHLEETVAVVMSLRNLTTDSTLKKIILRALRVLRGQFLFSLSNNKT